MKAPLLAADRLALADRSCLTKPEAARAFKGQRIYWHTSAHCWNNEPVGAANEREPFRPAEPQPKIEVLKVRPVFGKFVPWDIRVSGVEFRRSLIGE